MNNMVMSASIVNISKAILAAQKQMGAVIKDSTNPYYKSNFATLNAVREASNPQLNENGVSVLQPTVTYEGKNYVRTLLLHESGEFLGSDTEIICAKQNDPQAQGSAISYSRRYGLQSLLGLAASDDDAESAMNRPKQETYKANTTATVKPTNVTTEVVPTTPTNTTAHNQPTGPALSPGAVQATANAPAPVKKSSFKATTATPPAAKQLNWG